MCYYGKKRPPCSMMHIITNTNKNCTVFPFFTLTHNSSTPFLKPQISAMVIFPMNTKLMFHTIKIMMNCRLGLYTNYVDSIFRTPSQFTQ